MSTDLQVSRSSSHNALAEANIQAAITKVQSQVLAAKRCPRDESYATDQILKQCGNLKFAEIAMYAYPKGKQEISGLSIRAAEMIATEWGNFKFGIRELEQRPGVSVLEAFAWDVERNVESTIEFHAAHVRRAGKVNIELDDPRDIYETTANVGSRRKRACILALIPKDVRDKAEEMIELTLNKSIVVNPESIQKLVATFAGLGVTREMLKSWLNKDVEAMTKQNILRLRQIYASMRDGMSKAADWFTTPPASAADAMNAPKSLPPATPPADEAAQPAPPDDVNQGDAPVEESQLGDDTGDGFSPAEKFSIRLDECQSRVQITAVRDDINDAAKAGAITADEQNELLDKVQSLLARPKK